MKRVIINREDGDTNQVPGELIVDGFPFKCFTLERGNNNNQRGISCIPKGSYTVKWSHMASVGKDHYQVTNVPGRDAIFIHGGNRFVDSHGCILLGKGEADLDGDGEMDITNSGKAIQEFEALMNKEDFGLIIN